MTEWWAKTGAERLGVPLSAVFPVWRTKDKVILYWYVEDVGFFDTDFTPMQRP